MLYYFVGSFQKVDDNDEAEQIIRAITHGEIDHTVYSQMADDLENAAQIKRKEGKKKPTKKTTGKKKTTKSKKAKEGGDTVTSSEVEPSASEVEPSASESQIAQPSTA